MKLFEHATAAGLDLRGGKNLNGEVSLSEKGKVAYSG
jgi:hypothetical protein